MVKIQAYSDSISLESTQVWNAWAFHYVETHKHQGGSKSNYCCHGHLQYPKGVGFGGKFVCSGHSLGSKVHNHPPPSVSRLNGMHIVKVEPKLFLVANKMSQIA
jgi:hypothetical protein